VLWLHHLQQMWLQPQRQQDQASAMISLGALAGCPESCCLPPRCHHSSRPPAPLMLLRGFHHSHTLTHSHVHEDQVLLSRGWQ
jgi:hypothetical protein